MIAYIDGSSIGNPGSSGVGVVLKEKGKIIKEISKNIGNATNNVAEYKALIEAINEAKNLNANNLVVLSDSALLVNQINGVYKVRNETIKKLVNEVKNMLHGLNFKIEHISRKENLAHKLAIKAARKKCQN
ncbi:MAG: ribonuclease HI family protein [bacterium]|nr:ribonuclease HI family protein [bacterium]